MRRSTAGCRFRAGNCRLGLVQDDGGRNEVRMIWSESGGPKPEVPCDAAKGFGTRLIDRASVYELDGSADLRFDADGLRADIRFPYTSNGT